MTPREALAAVDALDGERRERQAAAGAALRDLRVARGLSLGDVARAAGVDKSNLSKLERGKWWGRATMGRVLVYLESQ